jgi:poly-gamma-glutamate synthesis protein (capsule biosynthesis protein)
MPTWYGRAHPDNVKSLVDAGLSLVTHASNHCFDYGPDALLETIDVLESNGIAVAGVGKNLADASKAVVLERKGVRIAFLDYNCVLPEEYEARDPDKPGCNPIHIKTYYEPQEYQPGTPPRVVTIPDELDVQRMENDIRQAKGDADIVFMSVHWGIHHIPGVLADYEFTVGHRAIDAGVDVVIGTHPHLLKGIEVYKGRVIFHSMGNFAEETPHYTEFDQDVPAHLAPPPGAWRSIWGPKYGHSKHAPGVRYNLQPDKRYTMMARIVLHGGRIEQISFVPGVVNDRSEPRFVEPGEPEFDVVVAYVSKWSEELGTSLHVQGDEVVVELN